MRFGAWIVAAVRLVHPAPTAAVTILSSALGAILLLQAGRPLDGRWLALSAAVLGSQIFVGASNDLVDRGRDQAAGRVEKPLASGALSPEGAVWVASGGLALQLVASLRTGELALALGLAAVGSALTYNIWLSRTPISVVPYLVSFGILPLWVAAGVGVPLDRVAVAPLLVGPFAASAHLANMLRDYEADAALGSRDLAQLLGPRRGLAIAWGLAMGVGLGVGAGFVLTGNLSVPSATLGLVGLAAVAQGIGGPHRLWFGILVAAVAWTAAWALASG
jgi:4-hydroxybenzoate polyprenyltransferase